MSASTDDPTGIDIPTSSTYMPERQVRDIQDQIRSLEGMLADPKARLEDRGAMNQNVRRLKSELAEGAPPETTPEQRDRLAREERELAEKIVEGMPSQEEMRKRPPGAVGKHQRWEAENKARLIRWKNIRRILHRGDIDPDVSNFERFRPTNSTLNMDNALIPGKQIFIPPNTQEYREGWDRTFGSGADSAEVEALKQRLADLEARLEAQAAKAQTKPRQKAGPKAEPKRLSITAPCGKVFHANTEHRLRWSLDRHVPSCTTCQERKGEAA